MLYKKSYFIVSVLLTLGSCKIINISARIMRLHRDRDECNLQATPRIQVFFSLSTTARVCSLRFLHGPRNCRVSTHIQSGYLPT